MIISRWIPDRPVGLIRGICIHLCGVGNDKTGPSTYQGCNVLDEGNVLVVGSEEEVIVPGSQDA